MKKQIQPTMNTDKKSVVCRLDVAVIYSAAAWYKILGLGEGTVTHSW